MLPRSLAIKSSFSKSFNWSATVLLASELFLAIVDNDGQQMPSSLALSAKAKRINFWVEVNVWISQTMVISLMLMTRFPLARLATFQLVSLPTFSPCCARTERIDQSAHTAQSHNRRCVPVCRKAHPEN
jgi:hypothetical protein